MTPAENILIEQNKTIIKLLEQLTANNVQHSQPTVGDVPRRDRKPTAKEKRMSAVLEWKARVMRDHPELSELLNIEFNKKYKL